MKSTVLLTLTLLLGCQQQQPKATSCDAMSVQRLAPAAVAPQHIISRHSPQGMEWVERSVSPNGKFALVTGPKFIDDAWNPPFFINQLTGKVISSTELEQPGFGDVIWNPASDAVMLEGYLGTKNSAPHLYHLASNGEFQRIPLVEPQPYALYKAAHQGDFPFQHWGGNTTTPLKWLNNETARILVEAWQDLQGTLVENSDGTQNVLMEANKFPMLNSPIVAVSYSVTITDGKAVVSDLQLHGPVDRDALLQRLKK